MLSALRYLSRKGPYTLAAGLVAGLLLPGVAAALKPWLAHMVVFLLFLTAYRIGLSHALTGLNGLHRTLGVVLVFQLVLPLSALACFALAGVADSPYAVATVVVLAAPAITGSPNLSIMLGADPEPAFRLLIIGTALLPLTMLPVFWLSPQLGDFSQSLWGALRLLGAITLAVAAGFAVRGKVLPVRSDQQTETVDGLMTLALAVIVVGLMAALSPALQHSPNEVMIWLALVFAVNCGMQVAMFLVLRRTELRPQAIPFSIVAGNRNIALFLVTMSPAQAEPLLIFLGCYQFPMYLTPILMRRLYRSV